MCWKIQGIQRLHFPDSQCSVWLHWTTRDRSPLQANDFSSSLCIQTNSKTHPASHPMGTGCFIGRKAGPGPGPGRDADRWPLTPISCRGQEWIGAVPAIALHTYMAITGHRRRNRSVVQWLSYIGCTTGDRFTAVARSISLGYLGPLSLLSSGYRGHYPEGKADGAWSWKLTCI
jgi:hypothetical protein